MLPLIKNVGLIVVISTVAQCQLPPTVADSLIHLIMVDGTNNVRREPRDERVIYKVKIKLISLYF